MFTGILLIIIGLSIIAIGIFARKNPTFGWRMNEAWKIKGGGDAEPSNAYIESIKFSGTLAISIGSFFIIFGILPLL
ncbi:hypothetical protein H1230_09365 [Paenibacillus sp. 19GGS1-52]|uniref:DUF6199 family natural product biosynthesis protein n=1 Tax=Paenibacillus sp. 19GGS1-52 TaxID=2758563 RepID=UPI001EFBD2C4|nr:DUF6199 family natural product biosynthesis protein [Paenibacillus sp. 19GGS1-52]ULO08953.1 hypothetical protein H1230_09365 [Paenibacillus sp. 19GGS1-52]